MKKKLIAPIFELTPAVSGFFLATEKKCRKLFYLPVGYQDSADRGT
jgi:hypothetical protein